MHKCSNKQLQLTRLSAHVSRVTLAVLWHQCCTFLVAVKFTIYKQMQHHNNMAVWSDNNQRNSGSVLSPLNFILYQ